MLGFAFLPRRSCAKSCCNTINIVCRSHTPVAWYSTGKKEKKRTKETKARQRLSKSEDESSTGSEKNITGSAVAKEVTANVSPMTVDRSTVVGTPLQHEKISLALSSSSLHWSPAERDYEALVAELLLYRRESLEPVLDALRKERALFDESVRKMEERIADMYLLREEIREMLQEGAAAQHQTLTNALQTVSDCNMERKKGEVASPPETSEEDADVEVSL
ncbi:hypothetical protein LSM04_003060 [Trypanosoma melophagium]|uniref:uncharacterized protein n=1 Tax=Trypanosoma melophagium TaxID=715481 RepID=UPI00351A5F2A|nr:hypothetical protein LSM04_003060 [Trypanosoma melophagium]